MASATSFSDSCSLRRWLRHRAKSHPAMPHNSNATAKITRVIVTSVIISYFILNFFFEWNRKLWMFSLALNFTELREIVINTLFALLE